MIHNFTKRPVAALSIIPIAMISLFAAACSSSGNDERPAADASQEDREHGEAEEQTTNGRVVLTESAHRNAGIVVEEVRHEAAAGAAATFEVPGQVDFDPARVALVSSRASGRIERITVVAGDRVRAGQAIAYLVSPAFLTAQSDFTRAARRSAVLRGTADEEGAAALADAARRRLRLLGTPDSEISRLAAGGEPHDLLPIIAPFAGSITDVPALAGAAVEPGEPIAKIADLSVVHVVADVPERLLSSLRVGGKAAVRLAAYPDLHLTGRIRRIHVNRPEFAGGSNP